MVDFKQLKERSKDSLERMNKKIAEESKSSFQVDETFWTPTKDKAGNATAQIRFLPLSQKDALINEDALPYVKTWRHAFQGPGGWYIEESLTTLGKNDPCSDYNTVLWNQGEGGKKQARKQKRKLTYVANIQVMDDPAVPENNGKLFKYRFGAKIFEKITSAMTGDEDTAGFDVFDFWTGANFRLKVKSITVDGQTMPNYDDSKFLAPSALHDGNDKELKKVWEASYSLQEIIDVKSFKTYDELKAKLNKVLGLDGAPIVEKPTAETTKVAIKPAAEIAKVSKEDVDVPWDTSDTSATDLKFFEDLVDD